MSRRPQPRRTKTCDGHRSYRTQHEAEEAWTWHDPASCPKCRAGKRFHVWQHGDHHHVGHAWIGVLAVNV